MKIKKNIKINKHIILNRFSEYNKYAVGIQLVTLFPYQNTMGKAAFFHIILNFSFKDIKFNKKRVLPFFLALELLSNQKCVATISSKDIFVWKLRRGMISGCKVTLRHFNMFTFLDTLILTLPRMEKLKPLNWEHVQKNTNKFIALTVSELILFYSLELGLNLNSEVRKLELNFIFNTFTIEEKLYLLTANKIPILNKNTLN